ncbi:PilZ domain-containing protein [Legionella worsleiensis]|uniref:PilZ domain-containing protein n=1 Tax=Legionella worsleiensis TaxID=45076 RepID=A0A0W1AJR8_9GAMM|nr:PilZ domain-containing protein [Legionella worsleiensis]KTD81613.1 hypothetical protein Lwor_0395 [Legionella worsleiensis]STY31978.1 Uncharacterised protein [Legionella worsleiensis]
MDERRRFFRIQNHGEILAHIANQPIEIIDISASGARLINHNALADQGIIIISVHQFSINMNYKRLRTEHDHFIIIFTDDAEIERLFIALKHLRDERRTQKTQF